MKQSKFYQIKNITEHEYTLCGCDGSVITRPIQDVDKSASAFTIQDAKDGDVLSYRDGQWIFIYKEKIDDSSFSYYTLYSTIHQDLTINDSGFTLLSDAIIPATKEQRDLLFQKMKEASYEWDAEKKELKKIEDGVEPKYIKRGERKPNPYSGTSFEYNGHTWGMCARDNGVEILIDGHLKGRVFTNDSNAKEMFIKALERVEEENAKGYKLTDCDKNSWWEDFKAYVSCAIEQKSIDDLTPQEAMDIAVAKCFEQGEQKHADNIEPSAFKDKLLELFQKFRYIKEGVPTNGDIIEYVDAHIQELINTIQNNAWSEEDEEILSDIILDVEVLKERDTTKDGRALYQKEIDWLKSLKDRVGCEVNCTTKQQWKPSEEQMNALDSTLQYSQVSHNSFEYLNSLFNDLKKLREE